MEGKVSEQQSKRTRCSFAIWVGGKDSTAKALKSLDSISRLCYGYTQEVNHEVLSANPGDYGHSYAGAGHRLRGFKVETQPFPD